VQRRRVRQGHWVSSAGTIEKAATTTRRSRPLPRGYRKRIARRARSTEVRGPCDCSGARGLGVGYAWIGNEGAVVGGLVGLGRRWVVAELLKVEGTEHGAERRALGEGDASPVSAQPAQGRKHLGRNEAGGQPYCR